MTACHQYGKSPYSPPTAVVPAKLGQECYKDTLKKKFLWYNMKRQELEAAASEEAKDVGLSPQPPQTSRPTGGRGLLLHDRDVNDYIHRSPGQRRSSAPSVPDCACTLGPRCHSRSRKHNESPNLSSLDEGQPSNQPTVK